VKIYLASWFGSRTDRQKARQDLQAAGMICTARWLDEKPCESSDESTRHHSFALTADMDLQDLTTADVTVLFTVDPAEPLSHTGGRHFEAGYAYGQCVMAHIFLQNYAAFGLFMRPHQLITVGPRENVFHHLPGIRNFPTWAEALVWLQAQAKLVDAMDLEIYRGKQCGEVTGGQDLIDAANGIEKKTVVN